jgi:hypothetical protein
MMCRFTRPVNSDRSLLADTPLRLFTSPDTGSSAGIPPAGARGHLHRGLAQFGAEVAADLPHGVLAAGEHVCVEHATPVLGHEDQMNVGRGNHVSATALRRHGGVHD